MGGNVFKDVPTRRVDRDEFWKLAYEMSDVLESHFSKVHILENVGSKQDFGDCDILVESVDTHSNDEAALTKLLRKLDVADYDMSRNHNVVSVRYKNFQFDLILTRPEDIEIAYAYFNISDSGNFIGKLVKQLGLKYAHNGLWYVFRNGDQVIENILISKDPRDVFSLVGLSYDRYCEGFFDLHQLFDFIATSPYFHPDIYLFENVNSISRIRDKKRAAYHELLEWCKLNCADYPKYVRTNRSMLLCALFDIFPEFKHSWCAIQTKMLLDQHKKTKFNGDIVSNITQLHHKELGAFMKYCRSKITDDMIFTYDSVAIRLKVLDLHREWVESIKRGVK